MKYTSTDIKLLNEFWIRKSRVNFFAFRQYMRAGDFLFNWFIQDLARHLQQFYVDYTQGKRPILLIQAPPQHGKSMAITDLIAWILGLLPTTKFIYASHSEALGIRCNTALQRFFDTEKMQAIFPNSQIGVQNKFGAGRPKRNSNLIELLDGERKATGGQFRNTTTGGAITGESGDIGVLDDAVKGYEEANSIVISEKVWNWFCDDFNTRFSKNSALLGIMTRWAIHDIFGRLIERYGNRCKVLNYQAIAMQDEKHRKMGEALFPELKPLSFLEDQKIVSSNRSWDAMYQGNPTLKGGNLIKDEWWQWWVEATLPCLEYKFITADTSQKVESKHDWNVFQCWGKGVDGNLYLLDKKRAHWEAPDLRREAEMFFRKHDTPKVEIVDPLLRTMYIEDKASGIGLIQELERIGVRVEPVPRVKDKYMRVEDSTPFIKQGKVWLNMEIDGIDNLTHEARQFPDGRFDDDIDTLLTAIEVTYINAEANDWLSSSLAEDDWADDPAIMI
jgi:predicted phage terminase large subunit-like protein